MKTRLLLLILTLFSITSFAQVGPVKGKQLEKATAADQVWMSGPDLIGGFRTSPFPKWSDTASHIATKTNVAAVDGKTIVNGSFSGGTVTMTRSNGQTFSFSIDGQYIPISQKASPNGVASLGADGLVPESQLPARTLTKTHEANSFAAMLALPANQGDVAIRSDSAVTYILKEAPATNPANWRKLPSTAGITTINGKTGSNVTLSTDDVAEGATNKYFTVAAARAAFTGVGAISVNNSNGQISLANSGVTASTYNNVQVNAQGIVTGGSNVAYLQAADLAAYKTATQYATAGQAEVHWNNLTNVPNNISLAMERQESTGSTSNTITLNYTPKFPAAVDVKLNGVSLHAADYSISGTTLTLGLARTNSDYITIIYAR